MRILRTRLYSSSKKKGEEDSSDAKERLANSLAYGTALAGIGTAAGAGKLAADELNERLAGQRRVESANEKIAGLFERTKNKLNREFNDYADSELSRANFKKNGFFKTLKNKVKRVIKDGGFVSVKDAKKALASNKAYFQQKYNDLLKQVEDSQKAEADKIEQQSKELKSVLLNKEEVFDGFKVDAQTRQKAYDAVTKPVFQTKDGRQLTAIQKFEYENPVEFRKAIGLYFVLTNEFKGIGNLLNKEVRKQVTSHLSNFEERLNQRPRGGNPVYMEGDRGGGYNSESLLDGGWLLDTGK